MYIIKDFTGRQDVVNQIKVVAKAFYAKEAVKDLTKECGNGFCLGMLTNKYSEAFTEWKLEMDNLTKIIFKNGISDDIQYTINVDFVGPSLSFDIKDESSDNFLNTLTNSGFIRIEYK